MAENETELPGPKPEERRQQEELEFQTSQERFRGGYSLQETLRTSEKPLTIRLAAMEMMRIFEDQRYSTENFRSRFDLDRVLSEIADRANALRLTHRELLEEWKVVTKINPDNTGEVEHPGYALGERKLDPIPKRIGYRKDQAGNIIEEDWREFEQLVPYIGTEIERKEVAEALEDVYAQIIVRGVLHQAYVFHEMNSENLAGLAEIYLHHLLTGEACEKFFNSPAVWPEHSVRTEGGVELRSMGEMYDTAIRVWGEIVGLSEKPDELKSYRERPGWQYLFPGSTADEPSDVEIKWVGDVPKWERGRKLEGGQLVKIASDEKGFRRKEDVEAENKIEKRRGLLTEFGNVIAHLHENPENLDELRQRIRRFLGGGEEATPGMRKAAEVAEELAWRFVRVWGIGDHRGWEIYIKDEDKGPVSKRGKEIGDLVLKMDMGPGFGSDYLKITQPALYRWKNQERRRDAGPIPTRARYRKFMIPLPMVSSYPSEINGKEEKRTLDELLWGYKEAGDIPAEPAHRYGELNWKKVGRYPEGGFFLRNFMVAREKVGIYDMTRKTGYTVQDLYAMTDYGWWEEAMKRIEVGLPDEVVAMGALRGKEKEIEDKKNELWEGIVRGVWDGVRSHKFYKAWLEEGVKVAIDGSPLERPYKIVDEIVQIIKDTMGIALERDPIPIDQRQKPTNFWINSVDKYLLFPYPDFIEI